MAKNGTLTRERILDAAYALILERGYAGMSLDHVIRKVGMTKGAFFYHFKSKNDLAVALMQRFEAADKATLAASRARAERLSRDPLQQVLIFIGLFEEMFEGLSEPYPGCLYASYIYELQQFDAETVQTIRDSFLGWRALLKEKLDAVVAQYPPRLEIDTASLADMFTVVIEGAFITSKALDEPEVVPAQLRHFRNYIELLFS
jgi:TetR/AcrR family transcriptional repressor of nem operon